MKRYLLATPIAAACYLFPALFFILAICWFFKRLEKMDLDRQMDDMNERRDLQMKSTLPPHQYQHWKTLEVLGGLRYDAMIIQTFMQDKGDYLVVEVDKRGVATKWQDLRTGNIIKMGEMHVDHNC